ncbi:MAG TPA: VCBS repeat-containing protein, partial [Quisquiliibacterium sp.]|nr:VCBS repeat-containing protein [Quisquiliibacterium sp.]
MACPNLRLSRVRVSLALVIAMAAGLSSCGDSDSSPPPFGPPVASDLGGTPRSLRWADFDGDGRLDLAFERAGGVWVALGNGDGTLRRPSPVGGFGTARFIAVGDLNADSKPDLAVLDCPSSQCEAAATLFTILGNGDASFRPAVADASVTDAFALAVGDLDGDGRADVIVSRADSVVSTLKGNGDGTLRVPVDYPTLPYPTGLSASWIEVADANGDGRPDIVSVQARSFLLGSVALLAGRGDG